jgi:hypothetical protein
MSDIVFFSEGDKNKTVRHVDKERESGGKIVLSGLRNDTFFSFR